MKKHKGFTLIELLVVILVIGILVGLGVLAWRQTRNSAIDNSTKTDIIALKDAIEKYYQDNGEYPFPSGCQYSSANSATCNSGELKTLLVPKYLSELPKDFKDRDYSYAISISPNRYALRAFRSDNSYCKTGKDMPANWYNNAEQCEF